MQLSQISLRSLLALGLATLASAGPYPRDDIHDAGFGYLMERACGSYCGVDNQYCCSQDEVCYTSAGTALCGRGGGGVTTTWTETRTYTSTSYFPPAQTPTPGEDCIPPEGSGQIACGPICCAVWQYCSDPVKGQCLANKGASSWTVTVITTTDQFSAPYRPTSGGTATRTGGWESATATPTGDAGDNGDAEPVGTGAGNLSGGAIAGIVIGTLAGVALLILCCFCCIVKGLWDTVMGILGLGKKKERVDVYEEHSHSHRPSHGGWFGGGGRPSSSASRKDSSHKWGWLAAGAGAAALLLGLKKDDKRRTSSYKPPRSDYTGSSSYYYSEPYTHSGPSSYASSDRRTRDTRRSRNSRATRASRRAPSRV